MTQQIELFPLTEYADRHLYFNDTSTRTKRPKGKTIAPLPKTAIALPTPKTN